LAKMKRKIENEKQKMSERTPTSLVSEGPKPVTGTVRAKDGNQLEIHLDLNQPATADRK